MSAKSAMVTVVRSITVASGVFAPGHLGELTQVIPFELVDAVLAETGRTERRLRLIPSRVAVYLVLALALFEKVSAFGVWAKLTCSLGSWATHPSEKALRDARRRVGPAPLEALFNVLAGPLASPRTPGACYRGYRTVAFDGCASTKVPDTARNRAVYGPGPRAGYPMVMLMTLVETGTRALIAAVFGSRGTGEIVWAGQLVDRLDASMLVLADRAFDSGPLLTKIAGAGAQILVRGKAGRRPPVLARLPDGSYLTLIDELRMRVIEAEITVTDADGHQLTGSYRLLTTLLDHTLDPAARLVALYHERWEIETAYLSIRHTMLDQRVLRSGDPAGLAQEIWAILTVYQALRTIMYDAATTVAGTDPDRMSFVLALETARTHTGLAHLGEPTDLPGDIGRAVLACPNPARRPRYRIRKLKSPGVRYGTDQPTHPNTTTTITEVAITIHPPTAPTVNPNPGNHQTPEKHEVIALINQHPQPATLTEIAAALGITGRLHTNRLGTRLNGWVRRGSLTRTAPATYTTTKPTPLTDTENP